MLSYVGVGLIWEGIIVLDETVRAEYVFQHITGLQLSQFKLKRRQGVVDVGSKRVLEYADFFNVAPDLGVSGLVHVIHRIAITLYQ